MSHTKEPWMSWRDGNGCLLVGPSTNYTVAQCFHMPEVDSCEANARRIVACVNACEGISTEDLEQFGRWISSGEVEGIKQQRAALQRECDRHVKMHEKLVVERDELLEALEHHQEQTRPIQRTIEALAKVKGGAA